MIIETAKVGILNGKQRYPSSRRTFLSFTEDSMQDSSDALESQSPSLHTIATHTPQLINHKLQ
jgi:hypothetical protein